MTYLILINKEFCIVCLGSHIPTVPYKLLEIQEFNAIDIKCINKLCDDYNVNPFDYLTYKCP